MGIGLDAWWNDPAHKTCNTFHLRGLFIFDQLKQHDAARFAELLSDLYRDDQPDPRTLAASSGRQFSPTWVRARTRLRTCRHVWDDGNKALISPRRVQHP
jgi:hypothetical protein